MSAENDKIEDIASDLRCCPTDTVLGCMMSIICNRIADRIESALKRERGSAAAMREALKELMKFTCTSCSERYCEDDVEEEGGVRIPSPCNAILKARAALSAPPRNCDVGTADEQCDRHLQWCSEHSVSGDMDADCANKGCSECGIMWAQMPYEADAEKGAGK